MCECVCMCMHACTHTHVYTQKNGQAFLKDKNKRLLMVPPSLPSTYTVELQYKNSMALI